MKIYWCQIIKYFKIILFLALILTLGGCESSVDIDDVYYAKAKIEGVELEVLSFEQEKIMLDDTVIDYREGEYILYKLFIAKEVYVYSYKDEHIFEEVELYWYCLEGHCSNIDETEYEQLKE